MDAEGLQDEGYFFEKIRKKRETNDPNPEQFWSILTEVEKDSPSVMGGNSNIRFNSKTLTLCQKNDIRK